MCRRLQKGGDSGVLWGSPKMRERALFESEEIAQLHWKSPAVSGSLKEAAAYFDVCFLEENNSPSEAAGCKKAVTAGCCGATRRRGSVPYSK
ncbi:MAG: hypothetical protein RRY69_08035, partial [Oscillospiraceae bacterium]